METFATERLNAQKLHGGHLADLVALHLDPDVMRYMGGVRSPEATRDWLAVNIAHWDRHRFGLWVLRTETGEFAGRAGIRHLIVDGTLEIEVAYAFGRTFWGRGFASEVTEVLASLGFAQFGFPSLVGVALRRAHGLPPRPGEIRFRS
jgi:RimJ/RimL family protein N-acetyltransferase